MAEKWEKLKVRVRDGGETSDSNCLSNFKIFYG